MNIVFFVVLLLIIGGGIKGYKRGMVEEISSVISLVLALAAIGMFVVIVRSYMEHATLKTILGIVCMTIAVLVYKISDFILSSLKLIFKMPVLNSINQYFGLVTGLVEALVLLWIIFYIIMVFEFGGVSAYILKQIQENRLLVFLFQNNYLADFLWKKSSVMTEIMEWTEL